MTTNAVYQAERSSRIKPRLSFLADRIQHCEPEASGRLVRLSGMRLEVSGLRASVGSRCWIETGNRQGIVAEVVGFEGELLVLMCEGSATGLTPGSKVTLLGDGETVTVGDLFGRFIDGAGRPLDGFAKLSGARVPLRGEPISHG